MPRQNRNKVDQMQSHQIGQDFTDRQIKSIVRKTLMQSHTLPSDQGEVRTRTRGHTSPHKNRQAHTLNF